MYKMQPIILKNKSGKAIFLTILCLMLIVGSSAYFISKPTVEVRGQIAGPGQSVGLGQVIDYDGNTVDADEPYLWERTANTMTYKNPSGSYTKILGQGIIYVDDKSEKTPHYVPWNSSFFPVINSTYKDYEYQLDTYYSDYEAYFQNDIKAGKGFMFEVNDYWFTYDLSGGKMQWAVENKTTPDWGKTKSIGAILTSSPSIQENNVRYNNSFLNTDVSYEMRLQGVKENFILNSMPGTPADFLYLEYTGELQFDSNLTIWANGIEQTNKEFTTSGSVDFKDDFTDSNRFKWKFN